MKKEIKKYHELKQSIEGYESLIEEKLIRIYKEHPELSVNDKIKLLDIPKSVFMRLKQKLNLKQDHWVVSKEASDKKKQIREEYSTGIYTYKTLGEKYGVTRERIRQICTDLHAQLKAEGKLTADWYMGKRPWNRNRIKGDNVFSKRILFLCAIAYKECNKSALTTAEITAAYYNVFTKNKPGHKIKTRVQIIQKLLQICKLEKSPYLRIVIPHKGVYGLTEEGIKDIDKLIGMYEEVK